jgi:hypothetical protein
MARLPTSGRVNRRWTPEEDKDDRLGFQKAKMDLKAVYNHSDSESSDNECRKMLYVMFRSSWDITSQRIVKTQCCELAAATPTPNATPQHKWMETSISFDASDCPKNMVGARQLPLLMSPTIANIKLYHILVDGGAALNLVAFKRLQILMSKLQPSSPFSRVGPVSVMLRGCISLPIIFGMPENFRTKSFLFDIVEVSLPFNAILGRLTYTGLWQSLTTNTWS